MTFKKILYCKNIEFQVFFKTQMVKGFFLCVPLFILIFQLLFFTFKCHMQKFVFSIGEKKDNCPLDKTLKKWLKGHQVRVTESEKKKRPKVGISSSLTVQIMSRLELRHRWESRGHEFSQLKTKLKLTFEDS